MAHKTLLIGIGHKARVGKDTVAWMLVDALRTEGVDARRYGFADALKAVCRVEYGMREKDAPLLQRVGVAYRDGSRACRHNNSALILPHALPPTPDVWVTALLDTIAEDAPSVAIIPDTRFKNELEAIRTAGGLYVRVDRPNRPDTGRDDTHISEVDLDGIAADRVFLNDATLEDLRCDVDEWMWDYVMARLLKGTA